MSDEIQPDPPKLELLTQVIVTLDPVLEIGDTAEGKRRIINITGGHFSGHKLSGTVLPGGADWQLVRTDGVAVLDARYTLQTDDGALIYVRNWGLLYRKPDESLYMRTTPVFETGDERYYWINNIIAVCSAVPRAGGVVVLDFYEVL